MKKWLSLLLCLSASVLAGDTDPNKVTRYTVANFAPGHLVTFVESDSQSGDRVWEIPDGLSVLYRESAGRTLILSDFKLDGKVCQLAGDDEGVYLVEPIYEWNEKEVSLTVRYRRGECIVDKA